MNDWVGYQLVTLYKTKVKWLMTDIRFFSYATQQLS